MALQWLDSHKLGESYASTAGPRPSIYSPPPSPSPSSISTRSSTSKRHYSDDEEFHSPSSTSNSSTDTLVSRKKRSKRKAPQASPHSEVPPCTSRPSSPTIASDSMDEFIAVTSRRKRRTNKGLFPSPQPSPPPQPPSKSPVAMRTEPSAPPPPPTQTAAPQATKPRPPPPIILRSTDRWTEINRICASRSITILSAVSISNGVRITVPDPSAHRALTKLLTERSYPFHTYALEEEKTLKVIIKHIPRDIPTSDVKDDLILQEFPVLEVHRLFNNRQRRAYSLVAVILKKTPAGIAIFKRLQTVLNLKVSVEHPHKRDVPGQCHRCQSYGHGSHHCHAVPRCVKCLESHLTPDCPRTKDAPTPPSCVLCGQVGHPANYRGCPNAPKPRKQHPPTQTRPPKPQAPVPTTNAWAKPLRSLAPQPTPTPKPNPPRKVRTEYQAPPHPQKSMRSQLFEDLALIKSFHEKASAISNLAAKIRSANSPADLMGLHAKHEALIKDILSMSQWL